MAPGVTHFHRHGLHMLIVLALLSPLAGPIMSVQAQAADTVSEYMTAVTHVATRVIPAVVYLAVTAQPEVAQPTTSDPASFFRHSFNAPQLPRQFKRTIMGLGSGILMDAQGYILTNYHVTNGAATITALLADKRT